MTSSYVFGSIETYVAFTPYGKYILRASQTLILIIPLRKLVLLLPHFIGQGNCGLTEVKRLVQYHAASEWELGLKPWQSGS